MSFYIPTICHPQPIPYTQTQPNLNFGLDLNVSDFEFQEMVFAQHPPVAPTQDNAPAQENPPPPDPTQETQPTQQYGFGFRVPILRHCHSGSRLHHQHQHQ